MITKAKSHGEMTLAELEDERRRFEAYRDKAWHDWEIMKRINTNLSLLDDHIEYRKSGHWKSDE
jgi:hypothetical protein